MLQSSLTLKADSLNRRLLLHVDDNPDELFLLERALRKSGLQKGWEFKGLPHGQAALDYLAQAKAGALPIPDLLVLDLKMPGVSGFYVLEWVTENLPCVPAVMLSSSDLLSDRLRARDLGSKGYFVKSSTLRDLIEFLVEWDHSVVAATQEALR
jgi:DNA-binding response OmpR family regulator